MSPQPRDRPRRKLALRSKTVWPIVPRASASGTFPGLRFVAVSSGSDACLRRSGRGRLVPEQGETPKPFRTQTRQAPVTHACTCSSSVPDTDPQADELPRAGGASMGKRQWGRGSELTPRGTRPAGHWGCAPGLTTEVGTGAGPSWRNQP